MIGAEEGEVKTVETSWLPLAALLSQPFLLAAGIVSMRKMRRLPEIVCTSYSNVTLALISGAAMILHRESFSFMFEFTLQTWILIVVSSILTVLSSTTKFTALKYQKASDLQVLAFVPNLWQFLIDLIIINLSFSKMQMVGFALLFLFYGAQTMSQISTRLFQSKRRLKESDDLY